MKLRYFFFCFFSAILISGEVYSQSVDHTLYGIWARRAPFGSSGSAELNSSITDENGNVYLSGQFSGKLNFADDICNPSMSAVDALKGKALFVMKLDKDGKYQWHIVYEASQGIVDGSQNSLASLIYDYKDGKLLLYGRLIYYGVMSTIGVKATYQNLITSSSQEYTKSTGDAVNSKRYYFQFLHVIDVSDGSTKSFVSPFTAETHALTAKFQGDSIHVIHMGWDKATYPNTESLISIYDEDGNKVGVDRAYPDQPYAARDSSGCGSTIIRHLTLKDGRQVMIHNSYEKAVPNDNIPSYYLLYYSNDYSVKQKEMLMSSRAIQYFPHIGTDNASNLYIATNYGRSAYWDTGVPITDSDHLDDYLDSGNDFQTGYQKNKVVLARMNPDYSIKWMFQIGENDSKHVIANDMKTVGDYTYLVGRFMGHNIDFNGVTLTNTEGGAPDYNWNWDVFYAVYDNETGDCVYAVNMGSVGSDEGNTLHLSPDATQVLIGGTYNSRLFQSDPSERLYSLTSNGTTNQGYVTLYSTDQDSEPAKYNSSFGDAPESYGVAVHHIYPCINLGEVTTNMSQLQSVPGHSVDADSALNDDGIDIDAIKSGGYMNLNHADFKLDVSGNLNVKVKVRNQAPTSDVAKVMGWIDYNKDGVFDGAEEASSIAEVTSTTSFVTLTWAGADLKLPYGTTYMRLRITTDHMDKFQPDGLFFNGEVEDYRLDFPPMYTNDDYVSVLINSENNIIPDILQNDTLPPSCTSPVVTITEGPGKGTYTYANNILKYTPDTDQLGYDTIQYQIDCAGRLEKGYVYINILPLPDNISDADCYIEPEGFEWAITAAHKSSAANHHNYAIPLVGDIDGDSIPDVVTLNSQINYLNILWGKDKTTTTIRMTANANQNRSSGGAICPYAMCKTKINGDEKTIIIVSSNSGEVLYAYDLNGPEDQYNKHLWVASGGKFKEAISIADFDNDGMPEVYVENKIFNAATGVLLAEGTNNGYSNDCYFTIAANVIGDEKLELIAGTEVCEVNIPNKTGKEGNSITPVAKMKDKISFANGTVVNDGNTVVADINRDGRLDVIFTCSSSPNSTSGNRMLIAWDVESESLLCKSDEVATSKGTGIPFVGNIDEEADLEVVFMVANRLLGFKPDFQNKKFNLAYSTAVDDESGSTGMTLFDFNQNGSGEIVYRDQTKLRIMYAKPGTGGAVGTFVDHNPDETLPCTSTTSFEYPVVADVDADGAAEIIVVGNTAGYVANGYLWIYKSGTSNSWAPARKVWNQYAYNAVNVNEDLTIPEAQMNPATFFPGADGVFGTSTDLQPFNAFLQQQTILNKNGTPLFLTPDVVIALPQPSYTYHTNGDSLVVTVAINNIGEASINAPLHITVYKNAVHADSIKYTYAYANSIAVGVTDTITFSVPDFKTWLGATTNGTKIILKINDRGNAEDDQLVCNNDNTTHEKPLSAIMQANHDYWATLINHPVDVAVLENDVYSSGCTPVVTIIDGPANGTAVVTADNKVKYTPGNDFTGNDTITYKITCTEGAATAWAIVTVLNYPDNISDPECVVEAQASEWMIQKSQQIGNVATTVAFVVGDMNNDGFPDIVAYGDKNRSSIKIFYGPEFETVSHFTGLNADGNASLAIGKIKMDDAGTYQSLVFYKSGSNLRALNTSGTIVWSAACRDAGMIGLADFNHDGWTEVYIANQIYDAATGKLLCDGGATENKGKSRIVLADITLVAAVDILGDSNLELVAGNKIYKVNIDRNATSAKPLEVISSVTPPTNCPNDGITIVADFNNDGKLEVLVRSRQGSSSTIHLYLWTPHTGSATGTRLASTTDNHTYFSIPFVGDIDGAPDGRIEIVTLGSNGIYASQKGFKARKYNETTNSFDLFWDINHFDQSGATGMTLFDFNLDGISEIVYRDENELKIINGSLKSHKTQQDTTVYTLNSFVSYSETYYEYPVVVDIYNNQSSAILVTSDLKGPRYPNGYDGNAKIDIYTSDPSTPWAPARKVWNQYPYNSVVVNEDLTIPTYQMNIATTFAGKDSIMGTSDDVRPYNNFLQQQTMLNVYGNPLFFAPNAIITAMEPVYNYTYDSLTVTIAVSNTGNAALRDPFYITVYKNEVNADSIKYVYAYRHDIPVGVIDTITFSIPDFSTWVGTVYEDSKLIVKVNDKGNAEDDQLVCISNNTIHEKDLSTLVLASDDYAITLINNPVVIDILANDVVRSCKFGSSTPVITISEAPAHGEVDILPSPITIEYTPDSAWIGIDSMLYVTTTCGTVKDSARVYVATLQPLSRQYIACPGASLTIGMKAITGVTYHWFADSQGGTSISTGNTLAVVKDNAAVQTWYVEARYNGLVFPRYRIDLVLAANCGVTDPDGCAVDGTVIWAENFDQYDNGLETTSPVYSRIPLPTGMTTYTFTDVFGTINPNTGIYAEGTYALIKDGRNSKYATSYTSRYTDDHTWPGNSLKGRFLITNGRTTADRVYTQKIDSLCLGMNQLYFSFWMAGHDGELEWTIYAEPSNELLTVYKLPKLPGSNNAMWKHYGFPFNLPPDVTSLRFEIYNTTTIASGNDVVFDDIEVRMCAPAVDIVTPATSDTILCLGNTLVLKGQYADDGTFGNDLEYRWMYSQTGDVNTPDDWTLLAGPGASGSVSTGIIETTYTKANVSFQDAGYYRLLVGNASTIDESKCRAMSKVIRLQVHELPLVTVTGNRTICKGKTTQLTGNPTGGTWKSLNEGVATVNAAGLVTGVNAGTVDIRYIATNASGCSDSVDVEIIVNPLPDMTVSGNTTVCLYGTSQLTATSTGGEWKSLNTSVVTIDAHGLVTGVSVGTARIRYKVTNAFGCVDSIDVTMTVEDYPVISDITGDHRVCVNQYVELTHATPGGVWSVSDITKAVINNTSANPTTVTGVSQGTVEVSYTVGSACKTTVKHELEILPLDNPQITIGFEN